MSQNRTTTVTSAQPLSSKWWCSGLIRKMRLPPRELEVRALHDDRAGHDEEQAADEDEQQLGAAEDRERGEGAAEARASRCRP